MVAGESQIKHSQINIIMTAKGNKAKKSPVKKSEVTTEFTMENIE